MKRPPIVTMHLADVPWKPVEKALEDGDKLSGVMAHVLREDPKTGASAILFKVPAGWTSQSPESHSVGQQQVVLKGSSVLGDTELRTGSYIYLPPYTVHGPG